VIQSHKHNAKVGLLLALLGTVTVFVLMLRREPHALVQLAALPTWAFYIWGCVQYARAKGRSGWMGLIGLVGLIGLFALYCLDDLDAEGIVVRREAEAQLFASDERVWRRATPEAGLESRVRSRAFPVHFGSAFAADGFGFVRGGRVTLAGDTLTFQGPRRWPLLARLVAFVVLSVGLFFLIELLAPFFALALVQYFAAFEGELELNTADVQVVALRGRRLVIEVPEPKSGARRKSILHLESDQQAAELAQLLEGQRLARAA